MTENVLEDEVVTASPPKSLPRKVAGLISSQPLLVAQMFMSASGAAGEVGGLSAEEEDPARQGGG